MHVRTLLLFSLSALILTSQARAEDYLNDKGELTQTLKVTQLQGGFAGFTGVQYIVAPDGSWTSGNVRNRKVTPKAKGKLSAAELKKLAASLEKYNLAKLPAKTGVRPGANPHSITFEFGKKKAEIVGRTPPKFDPKNPGGSAPSRFAGLWKDVNGLLKVKK